MSMQLDRVVDQEFHLQLWKKLIRGIRVDIIFKNDVFDQLNQGSEIWE